MNRSPWLPLALLVMLTGCEKITQQHTRRSVEKGREASQRGEYTEALRHYEAALDGTPATAETHYNMALICADRMDDPVGAMHHLRRYLELAPEGRWAKDARAFLKEAQLEVVTVLATGPLLTSRDATRLRNENLELRNQVTALQARVTALRERNALPPEKLGQLEDKAPAHARYYTVEPGDTLAAIARKFYNSTARWKDLQDANYHQLGGGVALKPGMKLIIPK